jgi:hypothetical protein
MRGNKEKRGLGRVFSSVVCQHGCRVPVAAPGSQKDSPLFVRARCRI